MHFFSFETILFQGLYSDKQYIACQGPLQDTCGDFWEMIIQYDVPKIVMLTRTEEKNPHNPQQTLVRHCYSRRIKKLVFN